MQRIALKYMRVSLKGLTQGMAFITLLSLLRNKTSMGKRIKNVCIELQGAIIRAWPLASSFLPNKPFILLNGVSATAASSAMTELLVLLIIFKGQN